MLRTHLPLAMAVSSPSLPLFLLLLIASSSCEPLSSPDVQDEYEELGNPVLALESIMNLLDPHQAMLPDWNPLQLQVNPCTYTFVTCTDDNRFVSLEISSRNLSGRLSPSIGNLTNLEYLVLSDNNITGTIPAEIGKIRGLKKLDLSRNQLYGEIPSSVFNLESLQYIDLSYNNLSGSIPRSSAGTLYVDGNPLICGENTGQHCSSSRTAAKSHKFVVAFGSMVACIIFLFLPIS